MSIPNRTVINKANMIKDFKIEKNKNRLVASVLDTDGQLIDIPIDGHTSSNILTLFEENLVRSKLTDKEIQQVEEYVDTRWDIEIS